MPLPSRPTRRFHPAGSAPPPSPGWRIPMGRCVAAVAATIVIQQPAAGRAPHIAVSSAPPRSALVQRTPCSPPGRALRSRLPRAALPELSRPGIALFRRPAAVAGGVIRTRIPASIARQPSAVYGGSVTDRFAFGGSVADAASWGGAVVELQLAGGNVTDRAADGGSITDIIHYGGTVRDPSG